MAWLLYNHLEGLQRRQISSDSSLDESASLMPLVTTTVWKEFHFWKSIFLSSILNTQWLSFTFSLSNGCYYTTQLRVMPLWLTWCMILIFTSTIYAWCDHFYFSVLVHVHLGKDAKADLWKPVSYLQAEPKQWFNKFDLCSFLSYATLEDQYLWIRVCS